MEIAGKTAIASSPGPARVAPSIIEPRELSERSDSSKRAGRREFQLHLARTSDAAAGTVRPDLVLIDRKRVNEAAAWISAKVAATLRRGAQDVGEYVLDTFFSSDPELAKSKNPQKNASYRALAERCGTTELPISKTWLNNAVGVAVMLRRLPEAASFKELPPSYQETLLPLRDPAKVEKLAKQAAANDLSFRALRRVVAEERAKAPKDGSRGRPPIPAVIKALNHSLMLFASSGNKRAFSKSEIQGLDRQQRRHAKACAAAIVAKLKDLVLSLE